MCKFIGKSNERILCKLSKSEILRLYSIAHVAMETTKTSHFTCQLKFFISIFFTCQVPAFELQPELPWFGKWHILTNCQNCVHPPYYPFFKVMRKRKKKYEVQIRFSKLSENEKQKAKFRSVLQCHAKTKNVNGIWIPFSHAIRKTVGTKVHALLGLFW